MIENAINNEIELHKLRTNVADLLEVLEGLAVSKHHYGLCFCMRRPIKPHEHTKACNKARTVITRIKGNQNAQR